MTPETPYQEKAMSNQVDTVLNVTGMTCGHCVRHVSEALGELQGVETVEVNLAEKKAVVRHDPSAAPLASLIAAITDAGYAAHSG
jgi:copper chaperone